MYVCLCNGTRDQELRQVAQTGIRCARRAYSALGTRPRCGRCLETAQQIVDETHRANDSLPPSCAA